MRCSYQMCTFVLVDGSSGLATVHVQKLKDTLLVFGNTGGNEYLKVAVGSEDLYVSSLLEPLEETIGVTLDAELGRHLEILSQYFGKSDSLHSPLSSLYKQGLIAAESLEQYFPAEMYI